MSVVGLTLNAPLPPVSVSVTSLSMKRPPTLSVWLTSLSRSAVKSIAASATRMVGVAASAVPVMLMVTVSALVLVRVTAARCEPAAVGA